jgi:ABC-type phosphate transport system auxiliary subunit
MASKARRVVRQLDARQKEEYRQLAERIDREEGDEIVAKAQRFKSEHDALVASLEHLMTALKKERERQGLSLADMKERTGIDRGALSRLESGTHPNPTIATLMRYARALGKELDVVVREPVAD